jgi:hypothetical protein
LFSNLMGISTMDVSEEGDDQLKARAPRRSMSF